MRDEVRENREESGVLGHEGRRKGDANEEEDAKKKEEEEEEEKETFGECPCTVVGIPLSCAAVRYRNAWKKRQ